MAKPSKKRAKSENDVVTEAKRKKEILDKVAQSNLPTKTILKELGISRSTYYSWLKRYEEEGEEGLFDSRSLAKTDEEAEKAGPPAEEVEAQPTVKVEPEEMVEEKPVDAPAEEVKEVEPAFPPPEQTATEPPESEPFKAAEQPQREEADSRAREDVSFGGDNGRKGFGAYAVIAVVVLVLGLLFSLSLSNYHSFKLKESRNTLTLWRGKFAPRGYEMVETFAPVMVGDSDVSELTGKKFASKDSAYKALFSFFMEQASVEAAKGNEADIGKVNIFLDKAESLMNSDARAKAGVTGMRLQLAKHKVTMAELAVQKAYKEALPVYQEALKAGLEDSVALESKVEAMKKALGMVPEEPGKEVEEKPAEAEEIKVEAESPAPAATEAQEVESSVAPKEEAPAKEEVVAPEAPESEEQKGETDQGSETSTTVDETVSGGPESDTADEPNEATKPTSLMEWVRSKRSQ